MSLTIGVRPYSRWLQTVLVGVALLSATWSVHAQQSDVGGAMQAFGNLSPDQQQAILQKLAGQTATNPTVPGQSTGAIGQGTAATGLGQSSDKSAGIGVGQAAPMPVFRPDDSLIIDVNLPGQRSVAQLAADAFVRELTGDTAQQPDTTGDKGMGPVRATDAQDADTQLLNVLASNNPYTLDRDGMLLLPGFRPIALAGLSEAEATRRLAAEPALQDFEIRVIRLPVTKSGVASLRPFGYDLFDNSAAGMGPVTAIPVPADYVVGPGDELDVQLYGSQNYSLQLVVSRDGSVNFPQLGPIQVGGVRYASVKQDIESRVERQMIGVRASVSIGETRTISVFVLGEATRPGSYTVSGLATVTSALFAAGGVKEQGSLRRIEVRRQGKLVRSFDLYDLLMRGDSSADVKLLPGDVVLIPPIGPTVSIDGEVQRPAIYELLGAANVSDLIEMAGGLTPQADDAHASLVHVNDARQRIVIDVNPSATSAKTQSVSNGDILRIVRLNPTLNSGVVLQGYVYRPGLFAWRDGLKLTDVIGNIDELQPNADQHYVLIRREVMPGKRITVLSADLAAALRAPDSAANVALHPRDTLTVFDLQTGRDRIIDPLMRELALEANLQLPTQVVRVNGMVKVPGRYPLEEGMRVSDLIRAGGNLLPTAYGGHAELSRFNVVNGEQRRTQIIPIDLVALARGDKSADIPLQSFDELSVKEISGWSEEDQVTLEGEVRFPGVYTIQRGESLRSVIERAGGLTDLAYAAGAVFTRRELRDREQEQLDRLAERMKMDLATMALTASHADQGKATNEYSIGQSLLSQIKATQAVGRLVIDLEGAMHASPGSPGDVELRSGDQLTVPRLRQEVMVLGEVQNPTSHLYSPGLDRDDYVAQSGGVTRQADRGKIYVVHADGRVAASGRRWLIGAAGEPIQAGDAIVVPLDTERLPALPMWQAVTQILYNIAIAAAAVHAL